MGGPNVRRRGATGLIRAACKHSPSPALSHRYARAATKSKSAFDAKRAAAAAAAKAGRPHASTSVAGASLGGVLGRSSEGRSHARSAPPSHSQREQRARGDRSTATVASWRDKLAAVQRRRAALERSMRDEAKRLVEGRATKEVVYIFVFRGQPYFATKDARHVFHIKARGQVHTYNIDRHAPQVVLDADYIV